MSAQATDANVDLPGVDEKTRTELEAEVFRRLVGHLRSRPDAQNIDLMTLAGFCRNCLSNWLKDAADARGLGLTKDQSREAVYGMPYEEWKARHQADATPEQKVDADRSQSTCSPSVDTGDGSQPGLTDSAPSATPSRLRPREAAG